MYCEVDSIQDARDGGCPTPSELRSPRTRQMNDRGGRAEESVMIWRPLRSRVRAALKSSANFVLAAVAAGIFALSPCAYGAGLGADPFDTVGSGSSVERVAPRPGVRVQPRAWEFMPPYHDPDLSPDSARAVDQLYDKLMRRTSGCCAR
jgi:hypothetical protein